MTGSKLIYIILLLCISLLLLFAWQYFFSIYEVTYSVEPAVLYADDQSIVTIKTVPLNSFGNKAWMRKSSALYEITEGEDLVEIIDEDKSNGILKLKALHETGLVIIKVKSEHSLFPTVIEILIKENIA